MEGSNSLTPLPGSERGPLLGSHLVGAVDPHEQIRVTIRVRPRPSENSLLALAEQPTSLAERTYLTHEEYEAAHGASPDDLAKVESFAHEHGLGIADVSAARRTVVLSGTVAALTAAFGTKLERRQSSVGIHRVRTGPLHVPADLQSVVVGIFGLDDRPVARPKLRRLKGRPGTFATRDAVPLTPPQVARAYNFPQGFDGTGQCIAILEFGGGFVSADLDTYFGQLGLHTPPVTTISVDNASNQPDHNPGGSDGEVMLDIEVAGSVAPGAKIAVYFAPNSEQGFVDALTTAIHDRVNNPSVISISWGGPELRWTQQGMQAMDEAFQAAAALGVTICVAAGDAGSTDQHAGDPDLDGQDHVDFPASDPFVLGCGGTRLETTSGAIENEVVWNDGPESATGGGISDQFDPPSYQASANVPPSANPGGRIGRGVPDVAGDASPKTGYLVRVDGINTVIGGTSAVAPLWAGLTAILNEALGKRVGFLNPLLYPLKGTAAFHDITSGNNGDYQAGPGWDPCTGLGSPDGTAILQALKSSSTLDPHRVKGKPVRRALVQAKAVDWAIPASLSGRRSVARAGAAENGS